MTAAIETTNLARRFGRQVAVDGIDLDVPERCVYGFLGQNGAGKTTTIRLLLGLLKPTAGSVRIFGIDVGRRRIEAARLIGALVETPCHYDHLTGRENLAITCRLLGAPKTEVDRVLETVDLLHAADRRVGGYSLGMRQRLGVARALIGRPKLLLLDEPTNGLDPAGIVDMRGLIGSLPERDGVTVFVSSHILAEIDQTATHVGLMHGGRLVLQAPVDSLRLAQAKTVRLKVDRPDDTLALLRSMDIAASRQGTDEVVIDPSCAAVAASEIAVINFLLVERGIRVSGLEVREPSLEEIFIRTIGSGFAPAAAPPPLALAA